MYLNPGKGRKMNKQADLLQQSAGSTDFRRNSGYEFASENNRIELTDHAEWAREEGLRLVQQIFLLQDQRPPHVVVFAGVDHGSGCSRICASVSSILAANSLKSICLVEANFRSPGIPAIFGTSNHFGFADALVDKKPIASFTKSLNGDNLWLLSAGALTGASPNLLTSGRLQERITEIRAKFDFVIVDAPPLTMYSDAITISQNADGMVLILEADCTRREAASAAANRLKSANVPILAAVLNKRSYPIPRSIYNRL
jgi:Mrp family chromosome partitioning ATPase